MRQGGKLEARRRCAKNPGRMNSPTLSIEPTHPRTARMAIGFAGFFLPAALILQDGTHPPKRARMGLVF